MRARPISITIVAWLFVAVGVAGLVGGTIMLLGEEGDGFDVHLASVYVLFRRAANGFFTRARAAGTRG